MATSWGRTIGTGAREQDLAKPAEDVLTRLHELRRGPNERLVHGLLRHQEPHATTGVAAYLAHQEQPIDELEKQNQLHIPLLAHLGLTWFACGPATKTTAVPSDSSGILHAPRLLISLKKSETTALQGITRMS